MASDRTLSERAHFRECGEIAIAVQHFQAVPGGASRDETVDARANRAFGLGAGFNVWIRDRVGLRAELRLQALGTEEGLFLVRVGIAFRSETTVSD